MVTKVVAIPSPIGQTMVDKRIEGLLEIIGNLHDSLGAAQAPPELLHVVGLMNGVIRIYEKTLEEKIDFTDKNEPLFALPSQVRFLEEKLNAMLSRIAGASIKLKTE